MGFVWVLLGSIVSGFLYRCGGAGKEGKPRWIPQWLRNTKARDLGCPLIALIALWFQDGFKLSYWWAYLLTFGFMFAALTTYWDSVFGFDNFWFHGFMTGLACFPLFWAGISWWAIGIRAVVLAVGMGLLSKAIGDDFLEEFARGFLIAATTPLFLL